MPELTAIHVGLLVFTLVSGIVLGWIIRSDRATREKIAVTALWQEQLESQQAENGRLAEQNKGLLEQISQFQATTRESAERAKELTQSLHAAFSTRDQLQRQMKECRSDPQGATGQRDKVQVAYEERASRLHSALAVLDQKDEKIAHLKRELRKWHSRLPPLVEKFSIRNREAAELESELEAAREQLRQLAEMEFSSQTRIEPLSAEALPDGLAASNEPHAAITASAAAGPDVKLTHGRPGDVSDERNGDPEHEDAGDDLKQIKGIGPAIEKTLHDLGINRFVQLAEMSEYEIDRVAQRLKGFRSRIYREDWLGQARDLQYQKSKKPS